VSGNEAMARFAHTKLDIAIVGGGASGCYCADRLSEAHPGAAIALFEASPRFGGRLWSKRLHGFESAVLELGGMFFCDAHENVAGLAERLQLARKPVHWRHKHEYLRGRILNEEMYARPNAIPYQLGPNERGKNPRELILHALTQIVPDLAELWPFTKSGRWGAPEAAAHYLRELRWGDHAIWECGFWNVLDEAIGNEALELIAATHGSAAAFRNANAYDAITTLMWEAHPGQRHYMLSEGYQRLALALKQRCEHAVAFVDQRKLMRVTTLREGFRLHFEGPEGEESVEAAAVILALPKRAIERLAMDEALVDRNFYDDLAAVWSVPACRAYLIFERPWWNDAAHSARHAAGADIAAAFTDQPLRQCYYFNNPLADGHGLLMTAFADDVAASFWTGLRSEARLARCDGQSCDGHCDESLASQALIATARRQLQRLHPDESIEPPISAWFVDWSAEPHGGGWHAWAPLVRSWEVRERIRQPNPRLRFYICGEAFATPQGWVEGAINNTEVMLEKNFDVPRPSWVRQDYQFET